MLDIAWKGSVDLVLGTFTAINIDMLMQKIFTPPQSFFALLGQIFAQLTLTLWLGQDLRGLLVDTTAFDPTGGIVFIASVFRQPGLWANVDLAAVKIALYLAKILPIGQQPSAPDTQNKASIVDLHGSRPIPDY